MNWSKKTIITALSFVALSFAALSLGLGSLFIDAHKEANALSKQISSIEQESTSAGETEQALKNEIDRLRKEKNEAEENSIVVENEGDSPNNSSTLVENSRQFAEAMYTYKGEEANLRRVKIASLVSDSYLDIVAPEMSSNSIEDETGGEPEDLIDDFESTLTKSEVYILPSDGEGNPKTIVDIEIQTDGVINQQLRALLEITFEKSGQDFKINNVIFNSK